MAVIAFISGASMNGPLLIERAMLFRLPLHNELVGALVVPCLVAERRLAPRSHGVIALHAAFTATVRMIHRVHHDAANGRANAHVTDATSLAQRHVFMIQIADLAD